MPQRKIIHIDMDAFFASVEQLDNPKFRGKPVIVGGNPQNRGVVAACSYEARAFGVHSAMPGKQAYRLCPQAIFVRPRKDRYSEVSQKIMAILHKYSDQIEQLSIDEAFLDCTTNHLNNPSATRLAEIIRKDIFSSTGLTASAGVSYNKFLAKIASDQNKPNGITVIVPEKAIAFLHHLPIGKFFGVGKVTEQKMKKLGINTGADLEKFTRKELMHAFGSSGSFFYDIVRGIDNRPVQTYRKRKSLGSETTFQEDILDLNEIIDIVQSLCTQVGVSLNKKKVYGKTLTLKVRYDDFTTITRSHTISSGFFNEEDIKSHIPLLLAATEVGLRKVRLLGITLSNLQDTTHYMPARYIQLPLPFMNKSATSPIKIISDIRHGNNIDYSEL